MSDTGPPCGCGSLRRPLPALHTPASWVKPTAMGLLPLTMSPRASCSWHCHSSSAWVCVLLFRVCLPNAFWVSALCVAVLCVSTKCRWGVRHCLPMAVDAVLSCVTTCVSHRICAEIIHCQSRIQLLQLNQRQLNCISQEIVSLIKFNSGTAGRDLQQQGPNVYILYDILCNTLYHILYSIHII